jgi:DNA modification methylase
MSEQIGLEPTPQEFVAEMVKVFRDVRRVLKDNGTVWLNLGDSYAGGGYSNHQINGQEWKDRMNGDKRKTRQQDQRKALVAENIKPKDLIGIPWRVAFALQADGWYLRQDIIWHKPNPMPESVTDRCTKAHEYVFLLSKSARYYYDADAIAEDAKPESKARYAAPFGGVKNKHLLATDQVHTRPIGTREFTGKRNKRSVWTITTKPYRGAHFATFPPDLVEPCILAGSAPGDTVLDPFLGSGTTLAVAKQHGRNGIGIELNPDYIPLAQARIDAVPIPLA